MNVEIIPAWRESYSGPSRPVRDGWHVLIDGEWANHFDTKREAIRAADRIRAAHARPVAFFGRCEALASRGTGSGTCDQPLDQFGQCARADRHI